ncbi:hypothetical protein AAMO2058_001255200 [Amorphochlora amoebiformis]
MGKVKIMSFTHEIGRCYRRWSVTEAMAEADDEKKVDFSGLLWGTLKKLLQMGLESKGIPTEKAIQRFAPSIHQLSVITSHPDLCSPAEYMEIFQSPLDFTLSSDKIWPMDKLIKF